MADGVLQRDLCDRVLTLRLNRPERRNAITLELAASLVHAFEQADADREVGCILLTGNGPTFCSGMDLDDARTANQNVLADVHERLFTSITWLRKPMIAAVQGAAVAGGTGLAANAHIVICGLDAKFGLTEIRVGLWPIVIQRAVSLAIGHRRTMAWCISGQVLDAQGAEAAGLVTSIEEDPFSEALTQARAIAEYSPTVLRAGLEYSQLIRETDWSASGGVGRRLRMQLMGDPDFFEGVQAFKEKRKPRWPSQTPGNTRNTF